MLERVRLTSQLHGQRMSWGVRFPFISPVLAATKEILPTAKRAALESLLEGLQDKLDIVSRVAVRASWIDAHFIYLGCVIETCKAYSQVPNPKLPRSSHSEWAHAVHDILEDLKFYKHLQPIERFFVKALSARTVCFELDCFGDYCGFAGTDIEATLHKIGALKGPLYFSKRLDDIPKLGVFRGMIGSSLQEQTAWKFLVHWFGKAESVLRTIGELVPGGTAEVAFGTEKFAETFRRSVAKPPVNRMKAESWDYIKVDLRRLTDAMCGLVPPEEVQRLSFYRARKDREDE